MVIARRSNLNKGAGITVAKNINRKEGATMKDNCKNPRMMFANPNICLIWDERLREWRHTTANRILSGLMGNYQDAKGGEQ